MNITQLKNTAISSEIVSSPTTLKTHNNHLVARWLIDENSKLYCQWLKEN
jgi:hypothetical protein